MKKIFIKNYGFFKFENPFREKKMRKAWEREFLPFPIERIPNQETDCN